METQRDTHGLKEILLEQWWVLLLVLPLFLGAVRPFYGLTADDAFISFRYAQNWAAGCGPVYNCGEEPVEGYTNFLWMAMAAAAMSQGLKAVVVMRLAGLVFGVLALWMAVAAAWRMHRTRAGGLVVLVGVAASPFWAVNAVIGLETALATLSVLLAAYLSQDLPDGRRPWLAGLAWGASYLVRPEAMAFALFTGLYGVVSGVARRVGTWPLVRGMLLYSAGFIAVAGPYFIWRLAYYGDPFPNTYYAKRQPLLTIIPKNLALLGESWHYFVPLVLAALAAVALRRRRDLLYLFLLALVSAAISLSVHNNFWMPGHRLHMTAATLLAVTAGGLALVGGPRRRWVGAIAVAATSIALALSCWNVYPETVKLAQLHYAEDGHPAENMGRTIRRWARPGDWLAIRDAGMVPYYAGPRVKVLDMHESSLNDRHITRKGWSVGYVMQRKPRFLLFASPFGATYPLDTYACQAQGVPLAGLAGPGGERHCLVFAHLQEWLIARSPQFRAAGYRQVMKVPWHALRHFFLFRRD